MRAEISILIGLKSTGRIADSGQFPPVQGVVDEPVAEEVGAGVEEALLKLSVAGLVVSDDPLFESAVSDGLVEESPSDEAAEGSFAFVELPERLSVL
jgi:hypothetical protein